MMTGDQLKHWRETRNLSQEQLGELLGWTRDQVANRERDRAAMPEDLMTKLTAISIALDNARNGKPGLPTTTIEDRRRYLNLDGMRIKPALVRSFKTRGAQFYKYGWHDTEDDGHYFFLMELGGSTTKPGAIVPQCTPISLNASTWKVGAFLMLDNPVVVAGIEILQKRIDANRDNLPELSTVLMSNEEAFKLIGEIQVPIHAGMFGKLD